VREERVRLRENERGGTFLAKHYREQRRRGRGGCLLVFMNGRRRRRPGYVSPAYVASVK